MIRRPPRSTRTDTLFPYTRRFRPGGARRLVLEVALVPLERGSWTLPSWHVEQALAARAARELGWTVAPIRPPESGELGLRLQNKLSSKVLQNILIPSPLEGEAERDQVLRTLCDLADGGSPGEDRKSELQSLMRISYAVFCSQTKNKPTKQ